MPARGLGWVAAGCRGWAENCGDPSAKDDEEAHSLRNSNPNFAVSVGAVLGCFVAMGLGRPQCHVGTSLQQSLSASTPSTLKGQFPEKKSALMQPVNHLLPVFLHHHVQSSTMPYIS